MWINLYDRDSDEVADSCELAGEVLPEIGMVFFASRYPLVCVGHKRPDESDRPGVVVDEAPEELESLLRPDVESLARSNYELGCKAAGKPMPSWDEASPLQKRSFRLDADGLVDRVLPPGRN